MNSLCLHRWLCPETKHVSLYLNRFYLDFNQLILNTVVCTLNEIKLHKIIEQKFGSEMKFYSQQTENAENKTKRIFKIRFTMKTLLFLLLDFVLYLSQVVVCTGFCREHFVSGSLGLKRYEMKTFSREFIKHKLHVGLNSFYCF